MGARQVEGVHCRVVGRACDGGQDADDAVGPRRIGLTGGIRAPAGAACRAKSQVDGRDIDEVGPGLECRLGILGSGHVGAELGLRGVAGAAPFACAEA